MGKIIVRRIIRKRKTDESADKTVRKCHSQLPRSLVGYQSPLLITAVAFGHEALARYYIQHGGSMYGESGGMSILELALQSKSLEVIKCMMGYNFDVRTVNPQHITRLLAKLMTYEHSSQDAGEHGDRIFVENAQRLLTASGVELQKKKRSVYSLQDITAVCVRRCLNQNGGNTFTKVPLLCMVKDEDGLPIVTKRAIDILVNDIEFANFADCWVENCCQF